MTTAFSLLPAKSTRGLPTLFQCMGFAFMCFGIWGFCTVSHGAELPDVGQCRNGTQTPLPVAPEIRGWCLMIDPARGNCLSCHHVATDRWPKNLDAAGNIGPILGQLSERFGDHTELVKFLYDATALYPHTSMPPYGKHLILNDQELDQIATFLLQVQ